MLSILSKALVGMHSPSRLLALEKFRAMARNPSEMSPLDLTGVMKRDPEIRADEQGIVSPRPAAM